MKNIRIFSLFFFFLIFNTSCIDQMILDGNKLIDQTEGVLDEYYSYELNEKLALEYDYVGDKDSVFANIKRPLPHVTNNKEIKKTFDQASSFPSTIKVIDKIDLVYLNSVTEETPILIGESYDPKSASGYNIMEGFPLAKATSGYSDKIVVI